MATNPNLLAIQKSLSAAGIAVNPQLMNALAMELNKDELLRMILERPDPLHPHQSATLMNAVKAFVAENGLMQDPKQLKAIEDHFTKGMNTKRAMAGNMLRVKAWFGKLGDAALRRKVKGIPDSGRRRWR